MSAPQPPTNGDEPGTGADATGGSAATPAETPQSPTAKAPSRKAEPRKPADATEVPPSSAAAEAAEASEPQSSEPQPTQPTEPPPAGPPPTQPTEPPPGGPHEPPAAHQAAPPARTITEVFADRLDNEGFFSALFDFTFTRYVTRKLAGPVYVVGLVLIGLSTILALIYWLGQAIETHTFLGAFVFLFGLIITVVGSALAILLLRVAIEVFVAVVAIAENTRPRGKQGP
jgi:hypothetical protein